MENRVRLRFDRSKDIRTDYYYIYRSNTPGVSRRSPRIMKVRHPRLPNPVAVTQDTAVRVDELTYQLSHTGIMDDSPVMPYINGVDAITLDRTFQVDYTDGMIVFDNPVLESDIVTVDYTFDGVVVYDDDIKQEFVIEYYGPYAEDTSKPSAPTNLSMLPNHSIGSITLNYGESFASGQNYYYRIESKSNDGNYSDLSQEFIAFLKASIEGYPIEVSYDGGLKWNILDTAAATSYTHYGVDKEPPEPIQNGLATVYSVENTGTADIVFTWDVPLLNGKTSYSPIYHVRSITDADVLSDPSNNVGPELMQAELQKVVIRRKVSDGISYPSYDSTDAVTVAEITDLSVSSYTDNVKDETTYSYSIFVVDKSGNVSAATTFEVATERSTAPQPVAGVTIEVHNYII